LKFNEWKLAALIDQQWSVQMSKQIAEVVFHGLSNLSPQRLRELAVWLQGLATLAEAYPDNWVPKEEVYTFSEGSEQ
jgi:hypothetical protein